MEMTYFLALQGIFDLAVLIALFWCVKSLKGYRRMVQLMTADSSAVPTDPKLIEEWARQYESLPPDSPKWRAYKRRLTDVGYFSIK